jgi:hypothetical protein
MTRVDSLKKKNHDPQLCIFLPLNPFFLFSLSSQINVCKKKIDHKVKGDNYFSSMAIMALKIRVKVKLLQTLLGLYI